MNQTNRFQYLLGCIKAGTATEAETQEFLGLLERSETDETLRAIWEGLSEKTGPLTKVSQQQILQNIMAAEKDNTSSSGSVHQSIPLNNHSGTRKLKYALAIAASFLLVLFAGNYFLSPNKQRAVTGNLSVDTYQHHPDEIVPGSNRAELVLADGSTVNLDSVQNGNIAIQGDVDVRNVNGQILYIPVGKQQIPATASFNTLRTPKGGSYQLTLADGTKLWLNAASTLRYPVAFNEKERIVELKGEAYFEVAKDVSRPFRVQVNDMTVEVKGTHFNIMAYDNEAAVKTTLIEGSVAIRGEGYNTLLRPGQEAKLTPDNKLQVFDGVNVEQVMAWKNGYFHFDRAGLEVLMRQIERWYDVNVVYEGTIQQRSFGGKISRSSNINDVLKILELSKVTFRIENKTIIVSNK